MSADSTQTCYRDLFDLVRDRLGGVHPPVLPIRSLDFARNEALQVSGQREAAGDIFNAGAKVLERDGASVLMRAANTLHKLAHQMMEDVGIPLIHIADATAAAIKAKGLQRPGLMITAFRDGAGLLHRVP